MMTSTVGVGGLRCADVERIWRILEGCRPTALRTPEYLSDLGPDDIDVWRYAEALSFTCSDRSVGLALEVGRKARYAMFDALAVRCAAADALLAELSEAKGWVRYGLAGRSDDLERFAAAAKITLDFKQENRRPPGRISATEAKALGSRAARDADWAFASLPLYEELVDEPPFCVELLSEGSDADTLALAVRGLAQYSHPAGAQAALAAIPRSEFLYVRCFLAAYVIGSINALSGNTGLVVPDLRARACLRSPEYRAFG